MSAMEATHNGHPSAIFAAPAGATRLRGRAEP